MTELRKTDFMLEVAKGNVPGHSHINKFGHNAAVAITGEDVWAGGGTYNFYPTSAVACTIVSDSVNDDGSPVGTGARTVEVYGLDSNWDLQQETVTIDGTTSVNLANSYIRLYRAEVLTAGSVGTNDGNITIAGGGNTGAYIAAGDGQTQQAIYTIPNGKTGYFIKGYVAISDDDKAGEVAEFKWKARANNGTTGAWQTKGQMANRSNGSGWWAYEYGIPVGPIPEKTDLRIECFSATDIVGVVGGFDLVLVDD